MKSKIASLIWLGMVLITNSVQAIPVSFISPYHYRETITSNLFGHPAQDNLVFGSEVSPSTGTTVTATQNGVTVPVSGLDLVNGQALNFLTGAIAYDPTFTGSWLLTAYNGGDITQANTNSIGTTVGPMPFVENLSISGAILTPTLTWDLPTSTTEFDRTAVRIFEPATGLSRIGQPNFPTGGLDTSFTVPAGLLEPNRDYLFRVLLNDFNSSGQLINRSSTLINYSTTIPIPATLYLLLGGLILLVNMVRRDQKALKRKESQLKEPGSVYSFTL